MKLSDVRTIRQVSDETGVHYRTLQDRISLKSFDMIEGIDYLKLGSGQSTILSPEGIEKLLKTKEER